MAKLLEDRDGNKSSKRLFAAWLIGSGLVMTLITFVISLFYKIGDAKTIVELIVLVIGMGSTIDGLGIFDGRFGRKNDCKK